MEFSEALAHQVRGMTIMYFLVWSVHLYSYRKKSRMMGFLFLSMVCLALGFLKDSVFLWSSLQDDCLVAHLVGLTDMLVMLTVCNFFTEAVSPGCTRSWKAWIFHVILFAFIPLYSIFRDVRIAMTGYVAGSVMALLIVSYVIIRAVRQRKNLCDNYSYDEHISVRWAVGSCCSYILLVLAYPVAFQHFQWLNEVAYCILCMLLWIYIIVSAKRHRIITELRIETCQSEQTQDKDDDGDEIPEEGETPDNISYIAEMVAHKLVSAMETKKLYLNPLLSVKTVAMEIGTNTKYVSIYLNHTLGMTFYDYINSYRIQEACRILESMVESDRINMVEVSRQAGFNSVSSFNRYFRKVKGMTPMAYFKRAVVA
ncbi:MAG: helix-turn-helix domain-containing protein [Candidatus Cryptobacteroides sp.]